VVDQAVADRDFLLGDEFGAADIMMGYTLQLISSNGLLDDKYPHAGNYLARLKRRDAFQLAMNT
jgi:glutathione S-transferase